MVTVVSAHKEPVTGSFDIFYVNLKKLWNTQSSYWFLVTLKRSCDVTVTDQISLKCWNEKGYRTRWHVVPPKPKSTPKKKI